MEKEKIKRPEIPFEVVAEDTKEAIVEIINQSNLAPCFIANILYHLAAEYALVSKNIEVRKRMEYQSQLTKYEQENNQEE